jgi:hypothetical protein
LQSVLEKPRQFLQCLDDQGFKFLGVDLDSHTFTFFLLSVDNFWDDMLPYQETNYNQR